MCIDNFGGLVTIMYVLVVSIGLSCAWCIVLFFMLELVILGSVLIVVSIMCKILAI